MGILVLGIGLPLLALLLTCLVQAEYLAAFVVLAAFGTFVSIWKWKNVQGAELWKKSRFKHGRIVSIAFGIVLLAMAMLQIGLVIRTWWDEQHGVAGVRLEVMDIFFACVLAIIALALIGYEKLAAIALMEFFFSINLGGVFMHFFVREPAGHVAEVVGYVVAFLVVFILGRWFHWSKSFALVGLIGICCAGLGAYFTM